MKLHHIFRVAVCATLVALSLVGAGLFPVQPVAGQVTRPASLRGAAAINQLKQDGQFDSLQSALNQARFSVTRSDVTPLGRWAWHAPNPTEGYDAYITETGVSIAINKESFVSLSLHSIGYGSALRAVGPGKVSGDKQMINLEREGGVREWYVNGPDGLEQGFTLAEPPGAQLQGEPLRLALQVSEGWQAVASEDGQQVVLRSAEGETVEYSKLIVRDSQGREIAARMVVAEEQVVIEVEDGEAAYPLTIDPLFTFQQKLLAADGETEDQFGSALALSGDTMVIGAYWDHVPHPYQGSAYVFVRNGTGWTQVQKLTASDGEATDNFGLSVAIENETILVGAEVDDAGTNVDQGSVYVFTRNGMVWSEQQKLTAHDGAAWDYFGHAMAINGDTIAVGAFEDDIGANLGQGSVYIFERTGGVWAEHQKLTGAYGATFDGFGEQVALSGNTLVVGTPYDDNLAFNHGSVYVYTRIGSVWIHQQYLAASPLVNQFFGSAVAINGDTIAVGAKGDNVGANDSQGSVYVYTRSGTDWMFQKKLTASDGKAWDFFGGAVALIGEILVVGANSNNVGTNQDQGSVYVFKGSGPTWIEQQKLTAPDGEAQDFFGGAVAANDDTVMVAVPFDKIGGNPYQGSVYVFFRPLCSTLTLMPANLPDGVSGISYQQAMTVSGGAGSYQFAITGGSLPPGMSLSSSGLLSGMPTTPGTYQFTITATDLNGLCSVSRAYTLTILPPCFTFIIDPPTLPHGIKGSPYMESLTVQGGIKPYRFTRKSGTLPPGLSLSLDGVISGTPVRTGNFSFTVLITDAAGCATAWPASISIRQWGIEFSVAPGARRDNR